ncbi:MAG: hypothetical protein Q4G34_09205 [Micrococcus sp.]|nr:hypothetical protein [Micrococcus sp.]
MTESPQYTRGEYRPQPSWVTKLIVGGVAVLLALFLGFALYSGIAFIQAPQLAAKGIGVGILGVTVVGVWALYRELRFGYLSERMARTLAAENRLPVDDLPRSPGGRIERATADAQFETYRAETEAAPEDWRSWFRLALAYDAAGDRRRGRGAVHKAAGMYVAERRGGGRG